MDGLHRDDRDREERQRAAEDREAELIPLLSRMPVLPHPLSHFAELQGVGPDSAARAAAAQERARATHLGGTASALRRSRDARSARARARRASSHRAFEAALEEACAVLDICETELKEIEDAAVDASESAENDGRADLPSLDLETERDEWAKAVQVARRRVYRAQTDLARERPKHRRVACAALEAAAARQARRPPARRWRGACALEASSKAERSRAVKRPMPRAKVLAQALAMQALPKSSQASPRFRRRWSNRCPRVRRRRCQLFPLTRTDSRIPSKETRALLMVATLRAAGAEEVSSDR